MICPVVSADSWLWWIILSSVGLSLYDLCKKASVSGNSVFPTLLVTTFSGWAAWTCVLVFSGRFEDAVSVSMNRVPLLLVKSGIVAASWTATYFALKTLHITHSLFF